MKGNRRMSGKMGKTWLSLLVIVAMLTPMFSTFA